MTMATVRYGEYFVYYVRMHCSRSEKYFNFFFLVNTSDKNTWIKEKILFAAAVVELNYTNIILFPLPRSRVFVRHIVFKDYLLFLYVRCG